MPSIFNHEHSCWGVKRSSYNLISYDFNEDIQGSKLTDHLVTTPRSNNQTTGINPVNYSVSANGYYGFQPHIIEHSNVDNMMDIEENVDISRKATVPVGVTNMTNCEVLPSNNHEIRRKRHFQEDFTDSFKRLRQEYAVATEPTQPVQESHQFGGGWRTKLRRWPHSLDMFDFNNESMTQLLRQTHGCEMYLYERNCDY